MVAEGAEDQVRNPEPAAGSRWPLPQADRLETVRFVVYSIYHGMRTRAELEPALALDARHTRYYLNAAGALGLVSERQGVYRVTERGRRLLATYPGSPAEADLLRHAADTRGGLSDYFEALDGGASRAELAQLMKRRESLAVTTARRRARSLLRWHGYLAQARSGERLRLGAGADRSGSEFTRWLAGLVWQYLAQDLGVVDAVDSPVTLRLQRAAAEMAPRWLGTARRPLPGRSRVRRGAFLLLGAASDALSFFHALAQVDEPRLLPPAQARRLQMRRLALPAGGPAVEMLGFLSYLAALDELPDRLEVLLPPGAQDWQAFHTYLRDQAIPARYGHLRLDVHYTLPPLAGAADEAAADIPASLAYSDCIGVVEPLAGRGAEAVAAALREQLVSLRLPGLLVVCQSYPEGGSGQAPAVLADYLQGFGEAVFSRHWQPESRSLAALAQVSREPSGAGAAASGLALLAAAQQALPEVTVEHDLRVWYPGPDPILPRLYAAPEPKPPRGSSQAPGQLSFFQPG